MKHIHPWFLAAILSATCALAQDAEVSQESATSQEEEPGLDWITEGKGEMRRGYITVPEGYQFVAKEGADAVLEAWGNLPDPTVEGLLLKSDADWAIIYDFDDIGYVEDNEKDEIAKQETRDEMLKSFKEGQEYANKELAKIGQSRLFIDGWQVEPFYNDERNSVEYGLLLRDEGGERSVNYVLKRLGRRGVTNITLLCEPSELDALISEARKFADLYEFSDGEKYAEYKDGDKIAEYGLIGLVTGGALLGAAKLGWLGKFGKSIWIGVAVVGAAIWKGIKKITGRA